MITTTVHIGGGIGLDSGNIEKLDPPRDLGKVAEDIIGCRKIEYSCRVIREAFAADPEWKHTYIANMRMYIYDHLDTEMFGLLEPMLRKRDSKILEGLLDMIFSE